MACGVIGCWWVLGFWFLVGLRFLWCIGLDFGGLNSVTCGVYRFVGYLHAWSWFWVSMFCVWLEFCGFVVLVLLVGDFVVWYIWRLWFGFVRWFGFLILRVLIYVVYGGLIVFSSFGFLACGFVWVFGFVSLCSADASGC